jgi:hypothetical protein
MVPVLLALLAVLVWVAGRDRLAGLGVALAAIGALAYSTATRPLPDLVEVLRLAVVATAVAAAGALLLERRMDLTKLAAGSLVWFAAAYAPTYLLYVAPRHGYLPSVGVCLFLAVLLRLPARRPALEGAMLGLTALIATGFYAASLGEVGRWTRTAAVVRSFQQQMMETRPSLTMDTRVVVLGFPNSVNGVPALPGYALQAALREWYGHDQILAATELTRRPDGFLLPGVPSLQPYDRLLLFTWDHGQLTEIPK